MNRRMIEVPYGPWHHASNGGHWYVVRYRNSGVAPMQVQVLSGKNGNYRRFGSEQTSRKAAERANTDGE
jgi:hypothetical protein